MPEFNTRMTVVQTESALTHSWAYDDVTGVDTTEEPVHVEVPTGVGATVEAQLRAARAFTFDHEDREGADAWDYLRAVVGNDINLVWTHPTITDRFVQLTYKVLEVERYETVQRRFFNLAVSSAPRPHLVNGVGAPRRQRGGGQDIVLYTDTSKAAVFTPSGAFTSAGVGALVGLSSLDTWILSLDRPDLDEGFTLETWGKRLGATSSVDFLGLDSGDTASTVEIVLDVRYDSRIATGQTCMVGSANHRITRVVETVSRRELRLTLRRLIA